MMCETAYYSEEVRLSYADQSEEGRMDGVPYNVHRATNVSDDAVAKESLRRIIETVTASETDLPTLRSAVCGWIDTTPGVASPHRTVPHEAGVTVGYRILDTDDAWRFASITVPCDMRHQAKLLAKYDEGYS